MSVRNRRINKLKNLVRNKGEDKCADLLKSKELHYTYESRKLEYVVPESRHKYTPDFFLTGTNVVLEYKGFFDVEDRKKHLLIKEQFPDLDIRLIFERNSPIRKGSKTKYSDWCDKYNIKYYIYSKTEDYLHDL